MGETEWREIPGYPRYEASNTGLIKSKWHKQERILKPWSNHYGHLYVDTHVNGERRPQSVHRLIAFAFVPNPENKPCINHKDNNPQNNVPSNLEWCTKKENSEWMSKQLRGTSIPVVGTNLRTGEVIRFDRLNDVKKAGFQPSCVCYCCKGKRGFTQHLGYRWEYA